LKTDLRKSEKIVQNLNQWTLKNVVVNFYNELRKNLKENLKMLQKVGHISSPRHYFWDC